MKRLAFSLLSSLAILLPVQALADEDLTRTTISGFGTLGFVHSSREEMGFVRNMGQASNLSNANSERIDSRFGIQINQQLGPQFELVGQLLAKEQVEQTLDTAVTRAFLSYRPLPGLNLRVGRVSGASLSYLMADYLNVGYSYPWVRPPETMYTLWPTDSVDGFDASYTLSNDDTFWRFKFLTGTAKATLATPGGGKYPMETKGFWGVTVARDQGPLKLALGFSTMQAKRENPGYQDLSTRMHQLAAIPGNPYSSEMLWLLDEMRAEGKRLNFLSLGAAYDDGRWVAQGEVAEMFSVVKGMDQRLMGYLSVGRRFGAVQPFVLVGAAHSPQPSVAKGNWGVLGPDVAALQVMLNNAQYASLFNNEMYGAGVRWDFDSRAAFKVQWNRFHMHRNGWGGWYASDATRARAGSADVDVISATLDFVF